MEKFKTIVTKVLAFWAGLGTLLITFGNTGIVNIPEWVFGLFSTDFTLLLQQAFDAILSAVGVIILVAQTIRGFFVVSEPAGDVKVLSNKDIVKLYVNPFKSF